MRSLFNRRNRAGHRRHRGHSNLGEAGEWVAKAIVHPGSTFAAELRAEVNKRLAA